MTESVRGAGIGEVPCLLVGLSVRALAEAAAAEGRNVCAIDAFADRETLEACGGQVIKLSLGQGWRISAAGLARALGEARKRFAPEGFAGITACGGFEAEPALIDMLAQEAPLLGNDATTVRSVREPRRWFGLLAQIGAPHPAVSFEPPAEPRGWLVKAAGGSGGWHVRPWQGLGAVPADAYFQCRAPGRPASALFVADGSSARVIGWQWQILAPTAELPWLFGGVMSADDMPPDIKERIAGHIDAIVASAGLRGLCGLDFLVAGGDLHLLELNPRPTASVALYPHLDIFKLHRDACGGNLADGCAREAAGYALGEAVLYAATALDIPADFPWPHWCRDVPVGRIKLALGQPVCSVRATAISAKALQARLAHRLRTLSIGLEEYHRDAS